MLFLAWPGKIGFGRSSLSQFMAADRSHFGVGGNPPSSCFVDLRASRKLRTAYAKTQLQPAVEIQFRVRTSLRWTRLNFAHRHRFHHRQNLSSDMGRCAASDSFRRSDDSIFLKRGKTVLSRATIGACNIIARAGVQRTAGCGSFVADSIPALVCISSSDAPTIGRLCLLSRALSFSWVSPKILGSHVRQHSSHFIARSI
jgi:hypothetical protein